jgi:hypothetical protein
LFLPLSRSFTPAKNQSLALALPVRWSDTGTPLTELSWTVVVFREPARALSRVP